MARVWRQGQNKPVYIYRFLVRNSIEAAILSRQHAKDQVSDEIMATEVQAPKSTGYSRKDLIQLSRPHLAGGGDAAAKSSKIEDCADAVMTALVEQQARLPEASRQLLGLSQACP